MEASAPHKQEDLGIVDGLVQLSMSVQSVLTRIAASCDISVPQARLLGVLRDREPTMAELGRLLDLDKSSTTGLVDRAERRGLVRREAVPEDGRSFRVLLTDEGRVLIQTFVGDVTAQIEALTDHLSETNCHRLALLASGIVHRHAQANDIDLSVGTSVPR
ncbi:MAG: MarR family transcriptional regulator [Acidimicrobiales bacterium]